VKAVVQFIFKVANHLSGNIVLQGVAREVLESEHVKKAYLGQ
jgi:ABC-type lipopolysaccharide export system ATPase subunit